MNTQLIAISKVYAYLVNDPLLTIDSTKHSLIQSTIYLAQHSGVVCGNFNFVEHQNNPYSPALESIITDNIHILHHVQTSDEFKLSNRAIRRLSAMQNVIQHHDTLLHEVDWIELLGIIVYRLNNDSTHTKIINELIKQKPKYTKAHVKQAILKLETYALI